MTRPRIGDNPRVPASISIDTKVLERAREQLPTGKMSEVCEKAIRQYLLMPLAERSAKTPLDDISGGKAEAARGIIMKYAKTWAKILSDEYAEKLGGKRLTPKEVLEWLIGLGVENGDTDGEQGDTSCEGD